MTKYSTSGLGRALHALRGYDSYGAGTTATLYIGRKAGLTLGAYREQQTIPTLDVERAVMQRRSAQVGLDAGATSADVRGVYKGGKEPTLKVELVWIPSPYERTRSAFVKNVKALAQDVAGELAQREILIKWDAPGALRGRTDTATPKSAPPATSKKFCGWVRKHSGAGNRTNDVCYVTPKKASRKKR